MEPQLPTSYAAFYTQLTTVINGLTALPYEESWEGHAQQYREAIQHLIDSLHYMLVSVRYVFAPDNRYPDILGVFADELAHYTPRPTDEGRMRHLGDHRSYAVRQLHTQLTELLRLERTWTLRQQYVQDMIFELAEVTGPRKGRLVMVRKAIGKLRLPHNSPASAPASTAGAEAVLIFVGISWPLPCLAWRSLPPAASRPRE